MLFNYLLIHVRSLLKRPILSLTNLFGLTLGIATCLLSFLHIQHELSYDQHLESKKQLYRLVNGNVTNGDGWVKVSSPVPPYLKENIPEIEAFTRLAKASVNPKVAVRAKNETFNEANFYMADPDFIDLFSLRFVYQANDDPLDDIMAALISERISKKLFGDTNPIGETIELGGEHIFTISGVFIDNNANSHIDFDYIINFKNLENVLPGTSLESNWGQYNYFAYVKLNNEGEQLEAVVESKIARSIIDLGNNNLHSLKDLNLQPVKDIHFTANRGNAKSAYDTKYLIIYSAVSLGILLISIINFINLTIASSTKRIREVGVRKAIGASRSQLILQYISESFLTAFVAMIAAIFLTTELLLPASNRILSSNMTLSILDLNFITAMLLILIIISMLAGFYIAVFVTGFQPTRALRGSIKIGKQGGVLKNMLLGTQFTISLVMILCSIFIYSQLDYLQSKDLGLNPSQIINISLYNSESKDKVALLKQRFNQFSWVESSTATRFIAGQANWHQTTWWEGQQEEESMSLILADESFIETLDLRLIEGDPELIASQPGENEIRYIINEAARDYLGWETALGKPMNTFGENSTNPIIGVVEDFNYRSLHNAIDPVVIVVYNRIKPGQLMVRIDNKEYAEAIAALKSEFQQIAPNTPFEYEFLDYQFNELYMAENRTKSIVGFITVLAILLALLGLYGLVSFSVQERTKEMAVRKVLGVRLPSILGLLSVGYLKILLLANLIALPAVYYIISNWLNNFNYRIDLSPALFGIGSLLVWLFVFMTIALNVYQVSKIDPVAGLRYE